MAANLYETLGIQRDATPDDIRKAYKKRALQTHPDRIPPTATETEKETAGDAFRAVNQAYEVLSNPQNRQVYDIHGVWPPPESDAGPMPRRQNPFPSGTTPSPFFDPFTSHRPFMNESFADFGSPFDHSFPFSNFGPNMHRSHPLHFMFSDPFELFRSTFGDVHNHFNDDAFFVNPAFFRPQPVRPAPPFGRSTGEGFEDPWNSLFRDGPSRPNSAARHHVHSSSWSGGMWPAGDGQPRWVEQSHMTRIVNGIKQSISRKKDSEGNEHITYTFPDGSTQTTINGVEQGPSRGALPSNDNRPVIPPLPRITPPPSRSRHSSSSSSRHAHGPGSGLNPNGPSEPAPPLPPYASAYWGPSSQKQPPLSSMPDWGHHQSHDRGLYEPQQQRDPHHPHHEHHRKRFRPYSVDPVFPPGAEGYGAESVRREMDMGPGVDRVVPPTPNPHTGGGLHPGHHSHSHSHHGQHQDGHKKKWWRPWA